MDQNNIIKSSYNVIIIHLLSFMVVILVVYIIKFGY